MQINEAIGILDNYFGSYVLNDREVAWQCIRKELVEGRNPSDNNKSVKCLCKSLNVAMFPQDRLLCPVHYND